MSVPDRGQIEEVARDVLRALTGVAGAAADPAGRERSQRPLVSELEVRAAKAKGLKALELAPGAVVTPLARDVAWDLGIELRAGRGDSAAAPAPPPSAAPAPDAGPAPQDERGPIALGADHGGFPLKEALRKHLAGRGLRVLDQGTSSTEACDYPDLAARVAKAVALGEASWGIVVDGAGIGSCMAANKVPGVLAATCHDEKTARNSREHNGANVLCLGAGSLDEKGAIRVVDAWLATGFGGGRHAKRVQKIKAIERGFTK